jgi:hypothetical protein
MPGDREPWFTGNGTPSDPYLRTDYQPVVYDLHVIATEMEPEERYEYHDPAAAVIAYNRLGCERRRAAVLTKTGHLPGMEPEIVGNYIPSLDLPPHREGAARGA